jgi:hypothetical protein
VKIQRLILILGLLSLTLTAYARKPAVDPIVGVETENYRQVPKGQETAFDFNDRTPAQAAEKKQVREMVPPSANSNAFAYFALLGFLALPFAVWYVLEKQSKKGPYTGSQSTNVSFLSDYKKEQEESDDDQVNKAS